MSLLGFKKISPLPASAFFFLATFAWVLILQIVRVAYMLPFSVEGLIIQTCFFGGILYLGTKRQSKKYQAYWWMLYLGVIFLIPCVSLFIQNHFLLQFFRVSILVAVILWILCFEDFSKKTEIHHFAYVLVFVIFGFYLSESVVLSQSSSFGWIWKYTEFDLIRVAGDDGNNYISLGQSLGDLLTSMYRLPGFPLVTRIILDLSFGNIYSLIFLNILCLLLTAHLLVSFATQFSSLKTLKLIYLFVLIIYFSDERLLAYKYVLTDPLNDLLMIVHLIYLFKFWVQKNPVDLKFSLLALVFGFFVRPTVLYYAISLWFLFALIYFYRTEFRSSLKIINRLFFRIIILPILILVSYNRVVHGTFSYSSMQSHILTYYTYGSMYALSHGIKDITETFSHTTDEISRYHQKHPVSDLNLSEDGIKAVVDKKMAVEKFKSEPGLFVRAMLAGLQGLIFPEGEMINFIILIGAVALGLTQFNFWVLLLWPLYLLPIYSFEGIGVVYRFTIQVILPCFMILFSIVSIQIQRWKVSKRGSF